MFKENSVLVCFMYSVFCLLGFECVRNQSHDSERSLVGLFYDFPVSLVRVLQGHSFVPNWALKFAFKIEGKIHENP